jgi:hypothetical protein
VTALHGVESFQAGRGRRQTEHNNSSCRRIPTDGSAHAIDWLIMISKLDLRHFSTSELAMGGVALATVALVTLIDMRTSQTGVSSAVQPARASLPGIPSAVQPQSPLDQSRFESTGAIDPPPSEPSEPRGASHEPQLGTANSNTAWNVAVLPNQTPETAAPSEPELNPENPSNAIWVQARLADLGYFTANRTGFWGPASRSALRDFKSMNGLQEDDQWDKETEQRLSSNQVVPVAKTFIGAWAEDADECRTGPPVVINSRAAKAVGGECDFRSVKRETVARWHVEAVCTDGESSWNANVNLKLNVPKLIWSSERGTATYVRCAKIPTSLGEKATFVRSFEDWLRGMRKLVSVHE